MKVDITPEKARRILGTALDEDIDLGDRIRRAAWSGYDSIMIKKVRKRWSDDQIKEIRDSLEDMGYYTNIASEAGIGPDCMTVWWTEDKPF